MPKPYGHADKLNIPCALIHKPHQSVSNSKILSDYTISQASDQSVFSVLVAVAVPSANPYYISWVCWHVPYSP